MRLIVAVLLVTSACKYLAPTETDRDAAPSPGDGAEADALVIIDADPGGPWLAGYTYRRQLTINRTTGASALADFPVGIVIASDAAIASHALASGADLVVTGDDAITPLAFERAGYTSATGATEIWVRVPSLPIGVTTLFLYYGGPALTNANNVWSSLFKGVWHLSDPASTTSAVDSTAAQHTLAQPVPMQVPGHAAGIAGLARTQGNTNGEFVTIADPVDGSLDFGTSSFSYSAWVNANANLGPFDQPFYKGGTSSGSPGYCIMLGTGTWAGKVHDGSSFRDITFSAAPILNQWVHLVVVIDRTAPASARGYLDGVQASNIPMPLGSLNTGEPVQVGRGSGGAQFSGMIDEVRIYGGALTADWVATEHANLATAGFLTVGGEQTQL